MKIILDKLFKIRNKNNNTNPIVCKFKDYTEVKKIFHVFSSHSNDCEIRFVGGCIRKILNGEKIDDIDLAVNEEPHVVQSILKKNEIKYYETGIQHGTITVILNNKKFEITSLRKDISTDGRHAKVEFTRDWAEDASRRDFSINSIYSDINGNLFDPYNGKSDLEKGIVKFIGDPDKRLKEDYLRILRYLRFFSIYSNFEHDKSLKKIILKNINGIKKISKDRLLDELKKLLSSSAFLKMSNDKYSLDILTMIFPELKNLTLFNKISYDAIDLLPSKDYIFILSLIIIDESDTSDYFFFKYNMSNENKSRINFLKKNFKNIEEKKFFSNKNLSKILYFYGSKYLIDLIDFKIFKAKKSVDYLLKLREEFANKKKPIFPIKAKNIMRDFNLKEGRDLGNKLKKLENIWVDNNFKITEKEIKEVIFN